jgi:hypothetical protein
MRANLRDGCWLKIAILAGIIAVAAAMGIAFFNPRITRYVESDAFRAELEKQTAKGLHFLAAHYEPIRRTGFLSAESAGFRSDDGKKALRKVDAHGIKARFNPLGVFLRRWQLDDVTIDSGEVEVQVYEPKPEPSPAKPWFHIFLPDRVYLRHVAAEPADVTWRFRKKTGGFFATRLVITPHGRDFEYDATGGTLKMALIPDLRLHHTHLLITKTLLTLYTLELASGEKSEGEIHAEGKAGTRDDRSVDFKIDFDKVPVGDWVPGSWKNHFSGAASGKVHWTGQNPKLESSRVQGILAVRDARVVRLPFLEKLATITRQKSFERLELNECALELDWDSPKAQLKNIVIEDRGKFRIEGAVTVREKSLGGAIELGMARKNLEWLPNAEEVFSREENGYLWTTVHLSGTIDKPEQDLSPRIIDALKESPGAFLGLVFRLLGDWLKDAFGE